MRLSSGLPRLLLLTSLALAQEELMVPMKPAREDYASDATTMLVTTDNHDPTEDLIVHSEAIPEAMTVSIEVEPPLDGETTFIRPPPPMNVDSKPVQMAVKPDPEALPFDPEELPDPEALPFNPEEVPDPVVLPFDTEDVAVESPPIVTITVESPPDPIALPLATTVFDPEEVAIPTEQRDMPLATTAFNAVAFNSAESETTLQCSKDETGGDIDVTFDAQASSSGGCSECRSFEGKADGGGVCEPPGSGWELTYSLGSSRATIVVTACPDMGLALIEVSGPDASSPFTAAERGFFSSLAQNVKDGTSIDTDIKGSLDALAVDASLALAAWPADEFPIDIFSWPQANFNADWYDLDLLVRKDRCSFVPTSSPELNQMQGQTAPAPTVISKVSPQGGGVSAQGDAPSPQVGCVDICRVTSDGNRLTLTSDCIPPGPTLTDQLASHPCDYEITPGCGCDEIDSMDEFQSCAQASGDPRNDCPFHDPVDRIDSDGHLKPVAPSSMQGPSAPAPTAVSKVSPQGGSASAPSPQVGCVNICRVTSDGNELTLTSDCVAPGPTLTNRLDSHPCDYEITPGCGCDEIDSMDEFRSCARASEDPRNDCPFDDPVDRIDSEGRLKPASPTPSPTGCTDVCHIEGHFNDEGGRFLRATAMCVPNGQVLSHLSTYGCDWTIFGRDQGAACDCTAPGNTFDQAMFDACRQTTTCPPFQDGRLDENGIVQSDPVCTHVCSVSGTGSGGIALKPKCLEPGRAAQDLMDHPCDYEIAPGSCDCGAGTTFSDIQNCAASGSCPDDAAGRLNVDGTLGPPAPTPVPCVNMCHVEYESHNNGGMNVNLFPQCNPSGSVASQLASNDCDWIVERDECDCLAGISAGAGMGALEAMVDSCSPLRCPARRANVPPAPTPAWITYCHLEFQGNQVLVEERDYPSLSAAEDDHDDRRCDWTVSDGCPCVVDGTFDVSLVAQCAPDMCPQKSQGNQGRKLVIVSGKDE